MAGNTVDDLSSMRFTAAEFGLILRLSRKVLPDIGHDHEAAKALIARGVVQVNRMMRTISLTEHGRRLASLFDREANDPEQISPKKLVVVGGIGYGSAPDYLERMN